MICAVFRKWMARAVSTTIYRVKPLTFWQDIYHRDHFGASPKNSAYIFVTLFLVRQFTLENTRSYTFEIRGLKFRFESRCEFERADSLKS